MRCVCSCTMYRCTMDHVGNLASFAREAAKREQGKFLNRRAFLCQERFLSVPCRKFGELCSRGCGAGAGRIFEAGQFWERKGFGMDPFMYHVAERWPRLRLSINLSNQQPRMFYPPPQLKLRSSARKRANFIHGPWYIGTWYISNGPWYIQNGI